ncbi:hypothetical protein WJX72_007369 [[Myrmecia] bisecta]|uniref:RRM domain-containing protein n=1 Tax=[Myrmecia] bisecta TaxID=41462 RepID=A0AAW1PKD5_9CHLO
MTTANLEYKQSHSQAGGEQRLKEASEQVAKQDAEPAKNKEKDRGREKERLSHRNGDRDKDRKDKDKEKDRRSDKDRRRSRSRERDRKESRSRDRRDKDKGKRRSRSRSRDRRRDSKDYDKDRDRRKRRSSRSRSRDRRRKRSSSRDRSKRARSRSRSRGHSSRRKSRSPSLEYGGYVPRKRQEEPKAGWRKSRSPSLEYGGYMPRKRQEEPKTAGYSTSYVDPYAALRSNTLKSMDPAEIARQMQEQQLKARQLVLQQQAASAVAAASKTQREVYVGNLVAGLVTEDALRQLFNSTMAAAFPDKIIPGLDAVVSVSMHSEGRYAFVELRNPEMATAALQLSNQVSLLGQPISVGRPSGYVDPSKAQEAAAAAAAALAAFQAGDHSAAMQQKMADLGVAVPAIPAPQVPNPQLPAGSVGGIGTLIGATTCLSVDGMVNAEVLMDNDEYKEVIEDLKEECGKYGSVWRVVVPRPPDPSTARMVYGSNNYGKAFVQFADVQGASKAKDAIHGRLFAGSTVLVSFVAPEFMTQF